MAIFNLVNQHLVNVRMLVRIVGWLLIIEAAFMLAPALTALNYGEADWLAFGGTSIVTALVGIAMATFAQPTSMQLGKRDAYVLTALVWVVFSLFGLIPFLFAQEPLSYSTAFFEAMSGFTTTGASAIPAGTHLGHGMHLWRAMMQWIGGVGIVLFTIAVIPTLNHSGGMQMFNAEVTGVTNEKITPRVSSTAKTIWIIYVVLTALCALLLWLGPMDFFTAICHAFGTISTGGYGTHADGICGWQHSAYVKTIIVIFMALGGVNFALIYRAVRGNFRAVAANDVFRAYLMVIAAVTVLFIADIALTGAADGWQSLTLDPLFQVVSILTSTGYVLSGFSTWGPFVLVLALMMMYFGGCAGSTSGGAKIDRILFLSKNCANEIYRCIYPRSVMSVKINGKVVSPELVNKVMAFLCIYVMTIFAGGVALAACGVPMVDALFSAFSCMSNTGIDASVVGGSMGYETLPVMAKWVLAALMLIGRLEIFTILVLFTPAFWRR